MNIHDISYAATIHPANDSCTLRGLVYFVECARDDNEEYGMENPLGIPTEREVSVLKKGLPIYRTLFKRNGKMFEP